MYVCICACMNMHMCMCAYLCVCVCVCVCVWRGRATGKRLGCRSREALTRRFLPSSRAKGAEVLGRERRNPIFSGEGPQSLCKARSWVADLSSRDGAKPERPKATKGQPASREKCSVKK